jgi:RHS repeat-associated protein
VTTVTDESDLAVKYMFNSLGSCINAVGPDGSAGLATFGNELPGVGTGVNSTRNKPTQISSVQKFVPNKVKNHDFEQTTDWSMIVDPAGDGSVARATDQKYVGSYSLKIVKNSTTNQNYGFQWVTIEKGKTYTLSAYVKTSGVASATYGAVLEASYYNSSGGRVLVHSAPITGTNDWARLSVTFTVPADSTSTNASAAPMLRYATGTAWFDCVQLEEGNVPNRYNLVENADFDYATSGLPNFWTRGTNSNANDIQLTNSQDTNPPLSSDSRYQIEGVFNQSKTLSQTLPITGNSGDLFVVGGWASGYATPLTSLTSQSVARKLSVRVGFYYNGTYNYSTANSSDFNSCIDGWQYTSAQVKAGSDFTSVQVQIIYDAGVSKISFDGIQLYKEPFGSNYVYDENGNIITVVSSSGGSSGAVYSNNNLVTLTLPNQGTQTFTYDGNHRRLSSASAAGVKTKTSYDSTGHLTQVQEGNTAVGSNLTYIQSSSEFDTLTYGGRYLTKTTDPFGNQVNYAYDADRGTNTSITLPNNLVITNNFKAGSDLLNYTEATLTQGVTARSDYTYGNNSRITEIKHNTGGSDVIYGFVYNTLGWLTNVSVGGNYLVTNAYMDYTGLLNSVLYGNGQSISYLYDDYNRLTDVNYNGSTKYKLAYDATGQVGYLKDLVQNKEYYYLSDASGRLSEIRRSDGSYSRYTYDISNSVTSFADAVLGNTHTTSYVYDTDHRMTSLTSGSISETVGYDSTNSINRVMSVTRKYNNATKLETQYAYVAGAPVPSVTPIPTLTSTRVYTVTNSNKTPIYYTYDANGNITSISQGTDLVQYYYDKLSELVRENVSVTGATPYTNVFVYDVGGNIQLKRTYTYQPGDSAPTGTPVDIAYQYNDASWADKLTSYGGVPLTYDAIGNPLSWTDSNGSWTATWSMGRQLATLSAVGKSISYRYGADGIRTQMTVNKGSGDVTTVYNTVGGVVTWEKTGTNPTIFYTYDGNGKLVSLEYKSAIYFYARNAQNDVIGLVDATTGNWVAQYVYDAWGRSLAVMDGSGTPVLETDTSHIANVNPYRYRGYRYDTESCLYYLNSRYYSPTISRFVNSDGIVGNIGSVLSHNMYSYCLNNPASMHDATGTRAMMLETVEATPHHDGVVISTAAGNVPPASIEESLNSGVFRISYVEYVAPKDFEHYENTVLGAEKMAIFTNAEKGVLIGLGIYAYDRLASKIAGAGGMPQVVASLFLFALAGAYVDAMEYADLERCRNTGVIAINYLGGRVTYKQWDSYPYIDFYNDIK